jgi:CRP/FNR family transcriptional regulator, cyclic AMP receptor protein
MGVRNRSQKIELLKSVPLFAYLSKRQLNEVAKHSEELSVNAEKVLAREGTAGGELFIIVSGKAHVTRQGKQLATLGPGDFIGEMALLDHKPRSATVTADEAMVLLAIGARDFKPLLRSVPDLAESLLETLASRLRAADEAITH